MTFVSSLHALNADVGISVIPSGKMAVPFSTLKFILLLFAIPYQICIKVHEGNTIQLALAAEFSCFSSDSDCLNRPARYECLQSCRNRRLIGQDQIHQGEQHLLREFLLVRSDFGWLVRPKRHCHLCLSIAQLYHKFEHFAITCLLCAALT